MPVQASHEHLKLKNLKLARMNLYGYAFAKHLNCLKSLLNPVSRRRKGGDDDDDGSRRRRKDDDGSRRRRKGG